MRIVFAGTPEFAATSLKAVLAACDTNHQVVAVYTQPDRPAGRGRKLKPSPVKELALQHQLPVYQPLSLKDEAAQAELRALQPDLMIVVAYGLLLPQAVLDIPTLGCINVHASLLPRWRGAAPIQRALLAGDSATGVTLMQMDAGLDTGAMLLKTHCPITATDTSASLHDKLAIQGGEALQQLLQQLDQYQATAETQNPAEACYAAKLSKEEARVSWPRPATELDRTVRGYNPWPVAWFTEGDDVIRIWQAKPLNIEHNAQPGTLLDIEKDGLIVACGEGCLKLTQLQLPGGRQMNVTDLLNGHPERFAAGQLFA
ncbi:methionyl-tRNA formyltransferase [Marinospirillum alkaliphilum]|uniref:Methionyl-tRNA formyltransferase n=1 Tax=Marinospirillum alkaliphilum DSM 21637 TaxID=1122209 RepID=A0A1K1ZWL7_9GAMM|nr:methionyl-tRNA formyltransferase [Marinospirillum alkaliphilum]SFX78480.1 methionyl-tRNA formyltransferase [Marinospirillum alkaliphilum DSM 21637]